MVQFEQKAFNKFKFRVFLTRKKMIKEGFEEGEKGIE